MSNVDVIVSGTRRSPCWTATPTADGQFPDNSTPAGCNVQCTVTQGARVAATFSLEACTRSGLDVRSCPQALLRPAANQSVRPCVTREISPLASALQTSTEPTVASRVTRRVTQKADQRRHSSIADRVLLISRDSTRCRTGSNQPRRGVAGLPNQQRDLLIKHGNRNPARAKVRSDPDCRAAEPVACSDGVYAALKAEMGIGADASFCCAA